ncbi:MULTISPECIES: hypothetical protein [Comamonas]|uniref:hypothetical protein n=1 Tax=Comamonas TaxID=283 RepID=UPI0015FC385E|nr:MULTISPECIES: hypothetical protein [Comamonas]UUC96472.1 hypothetical protein NOX35_27830 [Comamonas sp. C11]
MLNFNKIFLVYVPGIALLTLPVAPLLSIYALGASALYLAFMLLKFINKSMVATILMWVGASYFIGGFLALFGFAIMRGIFATLKGGVSTSDLDLLDPVVANPHLRKRIFPGQ